MKCIHKPGRGDFLVNDILAKVKVSVLEDAQMARIDSRRCKTDEDLTKQSLKIELNNFVSIPSLVPFCGVTFLTENVSTRGDDQFDTQLVAMCQSQLNVRSVYANRMNGQRLGALNDVGYVGYFHGRATEDAGTGSMFCVPCSVNPAIVFNEDTKPKGGHVPLYEVKRKDRLGGQAVFHRFDKRVAMGRITLDEVKQDWKFLFPKHFNAIKDVKLSTGDGVNRDDQLAAKLFAALVSAWDWICSSFETPQSLAAACDYLVTEVYGFQHGVSFLPPPVSYEDAYIRVFTLLRARVSCCAGVLDGAGRLHGVFHAFTGVKPLSAGQPDNFQIEFQVASHV